MEIKPVQKAAVPGYPQKHEVTAAVLKKAVPKRWVVSSAAKIALGALTAATLTGCQIPTAGVPMPDESPTEQTVNWGQTSPSPSIEFLPTAGVPLPNETPVIDDFELAGEPMAPVFSVAPLFVHGDGRGSLGCVMVAPPVFFSEQEALEIINEVAAEYGLEFSAQDSPVIYEVAQPRTNIYPGCDLTDPDAQTKYSDLQPDFFDANTRVAIEFVSMSDVDAWRQPTECEISVSEYDTKDAAQQLSDGLQSAYGNDQLDSMGVLYDPCADTQDMELAMQDPQAAADQTREEAVASLMAQARDFFEWLKSQGVI